MKKLYFPLSLLLFAALFAGDHRFSQNARNRHKDMLQYFSENPEKTKPHDLWHRKYMLDSLDGRRNKLADLGTTIDAAYVTDLLGNPAGGKARGFAYDGSYGVSLNINFSQHGIKGLELFSSSAWRTGTNLSRDKIDNQFTASQIYGSQTVKLVELYLLQSFFNDRFIIKAGRLCAGDDFLASPLYWQFVNNAFDGNPVAIFYNIPFTAYPNATWGAYLFAKPWDFLSAKVGVYNANSKISQNKYHGTNFTFSSTDGVVWISEWCVLINQGPQDKEKLPGNYKVGAFYLTGTKHKFLGGKEHGDPGLYFLFDQMIYRPKYATTDQGLTPFISLFFQPQNRNQFPFFVNGGFVFKGPFEKRPDDAFSMGFVYGKYSEDLAKQEKQNHEKPQQAETVLEANYWVQITPWFYVMPDIQYIIHPKGRTEHPNALVIGAQIGLNQW